MNATPLNFLSRRWAIPLSALLGIAVALGGCATGPGGSATTTADATPMPPPLPEPVRVPTPPFYSIQTTSVATTGLAKQAMQSLGEQPYLRAEKRSSGYKIRLGAWATREEANAAEAELKAAGRSGTRILEMETPSPWLLADGRTVNPGDLMTAAAAAEGPEFLPDPKPVFQPTPARKLQVARSYQDMAQALDSETRRLLRTNGIARSDGFTYSADVAPLMLYAARRGDQTLYLQLWQSAQPLIQQNDSDPYTRGFVLWRHKKGTDPDVTGSTEALRMARALWEGSRIFNRLADRKLALDILEGYTRHTYEMQGVWMARKYFAFSSRVFVNYSVITNYDPDLLSEVADAHSRKEWQAMGERSYALLDRAQSPSGMLYPIIQPELGATYPGLGLDLYGPNNTTLLEQSCEAAEGAVRGMPRIASRVLDFMDDSDRKGRRNRLYAFFDATSGQKIGSTFLSPNGYACLVRLASLLDDGSALSALEPILVEETQLLTRVPGGQSAPMYLAGGLLLAAHSVGAFNTAP